MIYITGDVHIPVDIHKLNSKNFPEQKGLTQNDYVIICGDFGGVWDGSKSDQYWIKWLEAKNFTTLFVDGNHENFHRLNVDYPVVTFCGGKAHAIGKKIYHLMRGEIFTLEGNTFFTMGGASSHDKIYRTEGRNWWPEELPSHEEYATALANLEAYNYAVDYVITHCTSSFFQRLFGETYHPDCLTDFFEKLEEKLTYKKWFFGHYHQDRELTPKNIVVFEKIIPLE